jgi:hypothetical protein
MNNFNSFILSKHIDRLAEKCVRENIPIVEFTQWYEEEGQYLKEGFWGDVGSGAAKGAGVGALAGGLPGAGWGAAAGGAYGAGKYLYNKFRGNAGVSSVPDAKKQAVDALTKLSQLAGLHNGPELEQMIAKIQGLNVKPLAPGTSSPYDLAAAKAKAASAGASAPAASAPVAGTPAGASAPAASAPVAGTPTPGTSLPIPPASRILRKRFENFLDRATSTKYNPDVISKVNWKVIEPLYNFLSEKYPEAAKELITYLINNNPNASREAKEINDREEPNEND